MRALLAKKDELQMAQGEIKKLSAELSDQKKAVEDAEKKLKETSSKKPGGVTAANQKLKETIKQKNSEIVSLHRTNQALEARLKDHMNAPDLGEVLAEAKKKEDTLSGEISRLKQLIKSLESEDASASTFRRSTRR